MNNPQALDLATQTQHAATLAEQAGGFANQCATLAQQFQVTDDASAQAAADFGNQIKAHIKRIETEREPMREIKRLCDKAMKRWTPAVNLLKDTATMLRTRIEVYRSQQRQAQAAALAAVTSKADVAPALAVLAPKPAGIAEREDWGFEVVDEQQIPREFWILDESKLNALARSQKDAFNVPGVRAVKRLVPVFRG